MFTPVDEQKNNNEEISGQLAEGEMDIPSSDIHTMPEKFLNPEESPKNKSRISWLALSLVLVVALGGIIVAVLVFLNRQSTPAVNTNQSVNQLNENTNSINLNINTNVNNAEVPTSTPDLSTALDRDRQRLEDITALRTALALYFRTYQLFPSSLSSLLGRFLNKLPQDPQSSITEYVYLPTENQLDYSLSFILEEGADWGVLSLPAGDYYASPSGVLPDEGIENQEEENEPNDQLETVKPTMGLDSDGDQLTDIEENIYNTNSTLADTDEDGYTDATEILNFYDPLDPEGRLINSGLTELYQNSDYKYKVVYPAALAVRSLTDDNSEVIFTSTTGEFIEVLVQKNTLGLSVLNWYLTQNPGANAEELAELTIDGLPAIQSPAGLTTYLAVGSNIYILAYNIGAQQQMNFYTTYQLFIRSFILE